MDLTEMDALVRAHRQLVERYAQSIARRWRGHVEADDLTGIGMMALLRAADSFNPALHVPFSVHAGRAARWAMLSEARTHAYARRGAIDRRRAVLAAEARVEQRVGGRATSTDLAAELGVSVETLRWWQRESAVIEAIDLEDIDSVVASTERTPEERTVDDEVLSALRVAVAALPLRLAWVVRATFFEERVLADVAAELGVSESRVSQLRTEAITMLREGLRVLLDSDEVPAPPEREPRQLTRYRQALAASNVPA